MVVHRIKTLAFASCSVFLHFNIALGQSAPSFTPWEGSQASSEQGQAFLRALQTVRRDPVDGRPAREVVVEDTTMRWIEEGGSWRSHAAVQMKAIADLSEWSIAGQATEFVYPGRLLWSKEIEKASLGEFGQVAGRPEVGVTVLARANQMPSQIRFDANSDFQYLSRLQDVFARSNDGTLSVRYSAGSSVESALLGVGLSASGWGNTFSSSFERRDSSHRSFALLRIELVTHEAKLEGRPPGGWVTDENLFGASATDPTWANKAKAGFGEPVIVSSVRYGRMLLVGAWSEANLETARDSLKFKGGIAGFSAGVTYDGKSDSAWKQMSVQIISVGTGATEPAVKVLGNKQRGGNSDLTDLINAAIAAVRNDASHRPAVLSFATMYLDGTPHQITESRAFTADKFGPVAAARVSIPDTPVSTDETHVYYRTADRELDFDDNSGIALSYRTRIVDHGKRVLLDVEWSAEERNRDRGFRNTRFKSRRRGIVLWEAPANSGQLAQSVDDASQSGSLSPTGGPVNVTKNAIESAGESIHGFFSSRRLEGAPSHVGRLDTVKFRIDNRGRDDDRVQAMQATWRGGTIALNAPRERPVIRKGIEATTTDPAE